MFLTEKTALINLITNFLAPPIESCLVKVAGPW